MPNYRDFNSVSFSDLQLEINSKKTFLKVLKEFQLFVEIEVLSSGFTNPHQIRIFHLLKSKFLKFIPLDTKATSPKGINNFVLKSMGASLVSLLSLPHKKVNEDFSSSNFSKSSISTFTLEFIQNMNSILHFSIDCLVNSENSLVSQNSDKWLKLSNYYATQFESICSFSESVFSVSCPLRPIKSEFPTPEVDDYDCLLTVWKLHLNLVSNSQFLFKNNALSRWQFIYPSESWELDYYSGHNFLDLLDEAFPWYLNKSYSRSAILSLKRSRTTKYLQKWVSNHINSINLIGKLEV